jgi:hypothetical protein
MRGGRDGPFDPGVSYKACFSGEREAQLKTRSHFWEAPSFACLRLPAGRQGRQGRGASKELNKDVRDFSGENLSEDRFC